MDLENFPTSESAKRMLEAVSSGGFYDKSYVGKWLFQVMGLEMDEARRIIEGLPYQAFPETATWGLRYHEQKYGLPVREDLSYEERRRLILERRDTKAPMTPWRMEQILGYITACEVQVSDVHDGGGTGHPNVFRVELYGDRSGDAIDLAAVQKKLQEIKQSHTTYNLNVAHSAQLVEYVALAHTMSPYLTIHMDKINYYRLTEYMGIAHAMMPRISLR